MNRKIICCLMVIAGALLLTATNGFSYGSYGSTLNNDCSPAAPYTGDCLLCHAASSKSTATPAKNAFLAGGTTLTDYFCPPVLTCTDNDGDTYSIEGGDCGPVDCNDSDPAINPGATENCSDGIDNNCNNLVDIQDPGAVNCDTSIIDGDGDGFTPAEGDCDDTDVNVNPQAAELCTDGIDNNCNGLVDAQDPTAVDCPLNCTDLDGDSYAIEGGDCGPVDCNDANWAINPGAGEVCDKGVDNDCDGKINEGCDLTCPKGAKLFIKSIEYDSADHKKLTIKGRTIIRGGSSLGTTITIIDADTGETLKGPFEVKILNGSWKTRIKHIHPTLRHITIISSNGCTLDETINRRIYN